MRYFSPEIRLGGLGGLVGAVVLGWVALASAQPQPAAPQQSTATYAAVLNGENEIPPVQTPGAGTAEITYDTQTKTLTWSVEYSGLSGPATAAHFHGPAGGGMNADVVLSLGDNLTSPVEGTATLTDVQANQLANGEWYVNIHTGTNPDGEIRGPVTAEVAEVGQPR